MGLILVFPKLRCIDLLQFCALFSIVWDDSRVRSSTGTWYLMVLKYGFELCCAAGVGGHLPLKSRKLPLRQDDVARREKTSHSQRTRFPHNVC